MTAVLIILSLFYCGLLIVLAMGMLRLSKKGRPSSYKGISVVVAARNEEKTIKTLIEHIIRQDYPQDSFELIVVSDRSTDRTEEIVKSFQKENVKLLTIPASDDTNKEQKVQGGKKRALAKGISGAKYEILAFTDADCLPSPKWLQQINSYFKEEIDYVAGYSPLLAQKNSLFMKLKNLERTSMFAVSAGSMGWNYGLTCTARNIAYRKSLYHKVNGFEGLEDIPSGDDDLMLQRMTPYIQRMTFMFSTDSVVKSLDNKQFNDQLHQETRRASKWKYYPLAVKIITLLVFLYYISLLWLIVAVLLGSQEVTLLLNILLAKILAEIIIIGVFLLKINDIKQLLYFPLAQVLYIPYFIFFAIKGTFGSYKWK